LLTVNRENYCSLTQLSTEKTELLVTFRGRAKCGIKKHFAVRQHKYN